MKSIVSITMVRNEIDIVEAFVRYHVPLVDLMIILDNGSTDGTADVILKLISDGFPVELLFDDNPSFIQAEIMSELLDHAASMHVADLIVPLDCDEFLISTSSQSIRSLLDECASLPAPTEVEWVTYVPDSADDPAEMNPIKRIRRRRVVQHNHDAKIVVPGALARSAKLKLSQGSHRLVRELGQELPRIERRQDLFLAHYPVRSSSQMCSKYLVGWLSNLARPEQVLFDWYPAYNLLKSGREPSVSEMSEVARHYNVTDKSIIIDLIEDPLNVDHVPDFNLPYTTEIEISPLSNVLNYTEQLAKKYSKFAYADHRGSESRINFYTDQAILQIIRNYALIDGWLSPAEAVALYRIARATPARDAVLCEIGSWFGRSSYVLAKALDERPDSCLYCIDPFDGSGDDASAEIYEKIAKQCTDSVLDTFLGNMQRAGVARKIKTLVGRSDVVSGEFDREVDLLFIDGNHDYESVCRDYLDWSPRLKLGGWIAFHDVGAVHAPGPKRVVEEYIVGCPNWTDQMLVEELYIARKAAA